MANEGAVLAFPLQTTQTGGTLIKATYRLRHIFAGARARLTKPVLKAAAAIATNDELTEVAQFRVLSYCRGCKRGRATEDMTHCFDCGEEVCLECDVHQDHKRCACTRTVHVSIAHAS